MKYLLLLRRAVQVKPENVNVLLSNDKDEEEFKGKCKIKNKVGEK
jgi:hypothetical protein